ncbi:CPBP family intramembrane glutamic endopeptidase [Trueperella sp. HMSC08H06]|uniref:CPBP family intramembrane glutamic endopeptidase n=1 Tax=Trueperella sp. HMSC08H06 TaxID=1581142 RepID=UPI00352FD30E
MLRQSTSRCAGEGAGDSRAGNYAGFSPTLAFLSPIIVGGAEEIANVGIIALLSRRYGRGWGFILTVSALVRGVIHLHHGSLAILLGFLPLSVFAVAFFRTTAMVSPLVVGHMLWNYVAQANGAIGQSLAREISYPLVTYLLPLATVGLLVMAILRSCGWQTSRLREP